MLPPNRASAHVECRDRVVARTAQYHQVSRDDRLVGSVVTEPLGVGPGWSRRRFRTVDPLQCELVRERLRRGATTIGVAAEHRPIGTRRKDKNEAGQDRRNKEAQQRPAFWSSRPRSALGSGRSGRSVTGSKDRRFRHGGWLVGLWDCRFIEWSVRRTLGVVGGRTLDHNRPWRADAVIVPNALRQRDS